MKKLFVYFYCSLFSLHLYAGISEYPQVLLELIQEEKTPPEKLKDALFEFMSADQKTNLNYKEARIIMFGELFLEQNGPHFQIRDVYCNKTLDEKAGVGPGKIPDPKFLNCEHTWPQSKFSNAFPIELQKSDLHHLFPSDMKANSTRNNHPFAEVNGRATNDTCRDSQLGTPLEGGEISFEPPKEHRGNVARAMGYFSIRYKLPITELQKKYFTKWNEEDPVDQEERARHDRINEIQGNRNPFIDYPELLQKL